MGIFTVIFIFISDDFGLEAIIVLTFSESVNLPNITPPYKNHPPP